MLNSPELAKRIRIHALNMTHTGGSSHIGSSFSIADILAVLYRNVLNLDPCNVTMEDRDRFILSKGHAGAAVYAVLAECGFFPTSTLANHYKNGSNLSGHVSHKNVPGVEFSTGSLGHGLSVGSGMAYGSKRGKHDFRVFVLLSDGECDEGSNWEAILFAAHHKLNNLVAIVDYNKIQSLDSISNTIGLEPFADKWKAFGWNVQEVDGHDHEKLTSAFDSLSTTKPNVLICHTVKGKGVSFMEDSVLWHYRSPQGTEFELALSELNDL